jgi:CIC family chloride channel protein
VLIGCGVAAGMATSYNAPIAGAIFVMEIVLGNFAMDVFAPIVVASVLATIDPLARARRGCDLREQLPRQRPAGPALAADPRVAGCSACCAASAASCSGTAVESLGKRRLPAPATAAAARCMALGGLVVGAIGIFMPETWGNGIEVIESVATVQAPLLRGADAVPLEAGRDGRHRRFRRPRRHLHAEPGDRRRVRRPVRATGSASCTTSRRSNARRSRSSAWPALTAATMHAPVTAVVLVFELTGHYELTLPVMLCSIVASITANLLDEDSYYTAAIKQGRSTCRRPRGPRDPVDVRARRAAQGLRDRARHAPASRRSWQLLASHRGDTIYVQDGTGALVGRIELQDVKSFLNDPSLTAAVIAADLTRPVVTARPDDSIATVMPRFDDPELRGDRGRVAGAGPHLLGRVRHQDVLADARQRSARPATAQHPRLGHRRGGRPARCRRATRCARSRCPTSGSASPSTRCRRRACTVSWS